MSKPNFFASIDALNCLLQMDFDKPSKDIDLTLDLIAVAQIFLRDNPTPIHPVDIALAEVHIGPFFKHRIIAPTAAIGSFCRENPTVGRRLAEPVAVLLVTYAENIQKRGFAPGIS